MPRVRLTASATSESPWRLEVQPHGGKILVRHGKIESLALDIDCDDQRRDGRYEGITLVVGGKRLEGKFHGATVSMLSVDHDAGPVTACAVAALDQELRVRLENGALRGLHPAGPDRPVYLEAVFTVDKERKLTVFLNGLYYLFHAVDGTSVKIAGQGERRVTRESKKLIEYFERVTEFEVADPGFGVYTYKGLVERLQLQVHEAKETALFEIDFDHAYKDRGQAEIPGVLRFRDPLP
jgi:hypothetical protein